MRRSWWLCVSVLVGGLACGDDGGAGSAGGGSGSATSASGPTGTSAMSTTDGAAGSTSPGPATSAGSTSDPATTATTATTAADSSGGETNNADPGGGTIDVTLSGCEIDLGGTVVVSYNGSLGVASVYDGGASLSGSFQFDLDGAGTMQLSTQHRIDTGNVINMVEIDQGTWTNLDADALSGGVDTIGGTLVVNTWDPTAGVADIEFQSVSLLNVVDGNVCTIDGTIVTTEIYP